MRKGVFAFSAGSKPFEVVLQAPCEVTGLTMEKGKHVRYVAAFAKPVPVKRGDVFYCDVKKKRMVLNGKPVERWSHPWKKTAVKIGWVSKKLRLCVFFERDTSSDLGYWVACCTRSYNLATGNTVIEAVRNLLDSINVATLSAEEEKRAGVKVIRWHVERTEGTRAELDAMERKAKNTGFILEGVDWAKSIVEGGLILKNPRRSKH